MTVPILKNARLTLPDTLAPDGAEIRVLLDRPQGATRLSLAEALVKPGQRTACVSHKTIEEFWYILAGTGRFHRLTPDASQEETAEIVPGDALLIPTGYRFWVENTGSEDLIFLCMGTPPWPGPEEAVLCDDLEIGRSAEAVHKYVERFDPQALYAALDAQRLSCGLSWQKVAEEIGVSASTLTRTKQGGRMEVDGMLAMVGWLGRTAESFTHGVRQKIRK